MVPRSTIVAFRRRASGGPEPALGVARGARNNGDYPEERPTIMTYSTVTETVGRTPLVELKRIDTSGARIFVKLESRNPCGSVKDRVGVALVEDAERRGLLRPGATLIEPTSGNTGIALAFVAAAKGYRLVLTMPQSISKERVAFLRMLGADIVFT